jgi:UDP-N-acetylglucosamine 2-epimerase (non-hydrolysing)
MKILVAFGTRPEAIKLAPVIADLRRRRGFQVRIVSTAQHRQLLDQVLDVFGIVPDDDLDVMEPRQELAALSARVLTAMDVVLAADRPDVLLVQGDTTSAFACGLAAFYRGIPVGHIEAGLRTGCPTNPFPEEINRRLLSTVAAFHFAPTERAERALLAEGIPPDSIVVTGNTVVDALQMIRETTEYGLAKSKIRTTPGERLLLVTLHRRESWGAPLEAVCRALRIIVDRRPEVRIVLPAHLNPRVRDVVCRTLEHHPRIEIREPAGYVEFVALMEASWLVLTDSGGVQEEAPTLGTPTLVLRETTERPEAIDEGVARLVGTDTYTIVSAAIELLDVRAHASMARVVSPFGDGRAAERIGNTLERAHFPHTLIRSGRLHMNVDSPRKADTSVLSRVRSRTSRV